MVIKGESRHVAPFRAEVVGSFLRPDSIKEARKLHQSGFLSDDELRDIENDEIKKLVQKQKDAGLQFVTRRIRWRNKV